MSATGSERGGHRSWLSCPTTRTGLLRVVSNPRCSNPQPIPAVFASLASLLTAEGHEFVGDSISLLDGSVDGDRFSSSGHITDTYLLALAVSHDAHLATFDTLLVTTAVTGGAEALAQIP